MLKLSRSLHLWTRRSQISFHNNTKSLSVLRSIPISLQYRPISQSNANANRWSCLIGVGRIETFSTRKFESFRSHQGLKSKKSGKSEGEFEETKPVHLSRSQQARYDEIRNSLNSSNFIKNSATLQQFAKEVKFDRWLRPVAESLAPFVMRKLQSGIADIQSVLIYLQFLSGNHSSGKLHSFLSCTASMKLLEINSSQLSDKAIRAIHNSIPKFASEFTPKTFCSLLNNLALIDMKWDQLSPDAQKTIQSTFLELAPSFTDFHFMQFTVAMDHMDYPMKHILLDDLKALQKNQSTTITMSMRDIKDSFLQNYFQVFNRLFPTSTDAEQPQSSTSTSASSPSISSSSSSSSSFVTYEQNRNEKEMIIRFLYTISHTYIRRFLSSEEKQRIISLVHRLFQLIQDEIEISKNNSNNKKEKGNKDNQQFSYYFHIFHADKAQKYLIRSHGESFPKIFFALSDLGIDWELDPIPIEIKQNIEKIILSQLNSFSGSTLHSFITSCLAFNYRFLRLNPMKMDIIAKEKQNILQEIQFREPHNRLKSIGNSLTSFDYSIYQNPEFAKEFFTLLSNLWLRHFELMTPSSTSDFVSTVSLLAFNQLTIYTLPKEINHLIFRVGMKQIIENKLPIELMSSFHHDFLRLDASLSFILPHMKYLIIEYFLSHYNFNNQHDLIRFLFISMENNFPWYENDQFIELIYYQLSRFLIRGHFLMDRKEEVEEEIVDSSVVNEMNQIQENNNENNNNTRVTMATRKKLAQNMENCFQAVLRGSFGNPKDLAKYTKALIKLKPKWEELPAHTQAFLLSSFPELIAYHVPTPAILAGFIQNLVVLECPIGQEPAMKNAIMKKILDFYATSDSASSSPVSPTVTADDAPAPAPVPTPGKDLGSLASIMYYLSKLGVKKEDVPANVFAAIASTLAEHAADPTAGQVHTLSLAFKRMSSKSSELNEVEASSSTPTHDGDGERIEEAAEDKQNDDRVVDVAPIMQ